MYKITRFYFSESKPTRTVKSGLTLEQAQAWCASPDTSSRTATSPAARKHTAQHGMWFDGYTECTK